MSNTTNEYREYEDADRNHFVHDHSCILARFVRREGVRIWNSNLISDIYMQEILLPARTCLDDTSVILSKKSFPIPPDHQNFTVAGSIRIPDLTDSDRYYEFAPEGDRYCFVGAVSPEVDTEYRAPLNDRSIYQVFYAQIRLLESPDTKDMADWIIKRVEGLDISRLPDLCEKLINNPYIETLFINLLAEEGVLLEKDNTVLIRKARISEFAKRAVTAFNSTARMSPAGVSAMKPIWEYLKKIILDEECEVAGNDTGLITIMIKAEEGLPGPTIPHWSPVHWRYWL